MDHAGRLEKKIDKMLENQGDMNVTLGKQQVSLEEHIRRTNALEQKLIPVEKHVAMINGALKLISGVGVAAIIRYLWVK